jgi:hypothetical protein
MKLKQNYSLYAHSYFTRADEYVSTLYKSIMCLDLPIYMSIMCLDLPIYISENGNACVGVLIIHPHVNIRYVNNLES